MTVWIQGFQTPLQSDNFRCTDVFSSISLGGHVFFLDSPVIDQGQVHSEQSEMVSRLTSNVAKSKDGELLVLELRKAIAADVLYLMDPLVCLVSFSHVWHFDP